MAAAAKLKNNTYCNDSRDSYSLYNPKEKLTLKSRICFRDEEDNEFC